MNQGNENPSPMAGMAGPKQAGEARHFAQRLASSLASFDIHIFNLSYHLIGISGIVGR